MHICLFLTCLTLFWLFWGSIHILCKWRTSVPFHDWVTVHRLFVPRSLHPLLSWRTLRLFPCLGCCKYGCCAHRGACVWSSMFSWFMPRTGSLPSFGSSVCPPSSCFSCAGMLRLGSSYKVLILVSVARRWPGVDVQVSTSCLSWGPKARIALREVPGQQCRMFMGRLDSVSFQHWRPALPVCRPCGVWGHHP